MNGWLNLILYELLSYLWSPLFLSLLLHGSFLQQCCPLDPVQLLVHSPFVVPLIQEVGLIVVVEFSTVGLGLVDTEEPVKPVVGFVVVAVIELDPLLLVV